MLGSLGWIGDNGGIGQLPVCPCDVVLNSRGGRVELKHAAWRQSAATVVEIHDLCTKVQMASYFKNTLRVVKHLAHCKAQLIEIDTGRDAQGIKKSGIHAASLSQSALVIDAIDRPGSMAMSA